MNCSVCGKPLLLNRVAFKCSCGAYVHAYCLDQHILEAHRPEVEQGYVDLNSDFHPINVAEPETETEGASLVEGFELPEESEARESASAESGVDVKAEGEEEESDDFSTGEMVEDQSAEEEADDSAVSNDED